MISLAWVAQLMCQAASNASPDNLQRNNHFYKRQEFQKQKDKFKEVNLQILEKKLYL